MSTVSVSNIKNASSSVNNAVTTSGGDLTNAAGVSFMGGSKNLLYNGAMQVAQRGTSTASITGGGYYTADRWSHTLSALGTWTSSIESDAPTGSGLRKSLKVLCTTADASPAAGDYFLIQQGLEGQDVQRIAKGTASAQQLTLSFWVKSNVTGTYVAALEDVDNTRVVSATYTISASATWEKKTITFPADTTGALDNDNGLSLTVSFWLAAGSSFTSGSLNTTWAAQSSANRAVGQTNLAAATNNYWQVTGVQLEVGPVATSFEFKSYGQELRECQRYCISWQGSSGANAAVAAYTPGLYSDANEISTLAAGTFAYMRNITSLSTTTVGTQGTDWAVVTAAGAAQTGFTVTAGPYGGFVLAKTSHGISGNAAFLATKNTTGKIIVSSEL